MMNRWKRREQQHYDQMREIVLDEYEPLPEPEPPAKDMDVWLENSVGGWLPPERRAAYLAELQGEP